MLYWSHPSQHCCCYSLEKHKLSHLGLTVANWLAFLQITFLFQVSLLKLFDFYPRPVLAFGYCRCLRLCVCVCLSVCLSVCQSRVCPRDNSSPVQARIAKFRAQMQNTLVKVPIVLWGDRPWPSMSNLTWKSNFTSFWACPDDNLSSVQAKVTKCGPKMHLSMVKIPIDLGVDQPWSSGSILT